MHEITYTIEATFDDTPVRGNALASGDNDEDRACEDEILHRLDNGDVWAWACVTVICRYGDFEGRDVLGGCSYRDEADFREPGGYFDDMKREAFADLIRNVQAAIDRGDAARRLALEIAKMHS